MRYYTHDKMAVVKKTRKYTGMAGEKGTFGALSQMGQCRLVQSPWNTVCKFFKKLKVELPSDIAIPILGTYKNRKQNPKTKTITQKDICIPCSLQHYLQTWKHPKCLPIDEWIKKMNETSYTENKTLYIWYDIFSH